MDLLLLLLLGSCRPSEVGLDHTRIRGDVTIPAVAISENEATPGENDSRDLAISMGSVHTRFAYAEGTCLAFSTGPGGGLGEESDRDWYSFDAVVGGTLTAWLEYPGAGSADTGGTDTADTGGFAADPVVYAVRVLDLDQMSDEGIPRTLLSTTTDGSGGLWLGEFEVEAGGHYAIRIGGISNEGDSDAYRLVLAGFPPTATRFLVGAYASADVEARGNPLGGAEVTDWELEGDTLTWRGPYEVIYVREVVFDSGGEGETDDQVLVDEGVTEAWLFAGNFPSVNAGLASGVLYSDDGVRVELDANETESLVYSAPDLVCDHIQPKQIGWEATDTEPNDDLSAAQELPVASGLGYVDVIAGALDFTEANTALPDVFHVTVAESLVLNAVFAWPDASANMDFYLRDAEESDLAAGWEQSDLSPEYFNTGDNYGFALEPGADYYLFVEPWTGATGSYDYTIELEWLAP